jgi:hypothetical protein
MNQPGFRLYQAIITVLGRTALIHKKEGRCFRQPSIVCFPSPL